MKSSSPKIADSELLIMKLLWEEAPQTAGDIIKKLETNVNWAPKTIKTLLNRLVKKEALGFEKEGRSYLYFPRIREKDYKHHATRNFINRVFDGALKPLVATYLEDGKLTQKEIEELKKILDNKGE
jgi:BlaI family transcriptional regulator, penicillinase repressor